MKITTVNLLYDNGTLTELYKSGFVSSRVFLYRDIYLWIDAQMKTRGINKTEAALEAEVKFEVSDSTIWRALRSFDQ